MAARLVDYSSAKEMRDAMFQVIDNQLQNIHKEGEWYILEKMSEEQLSTIRDFIDSFRFVKVE